MSIDFGDIKIFVKVFLKKLLKEPAIVFFFHRSFLTFNQNYECILFVMAQYICEYILLFLKMLCFDI